MSERHEFEFEIDATREEVWRALVDPDALRGWFASDARVTPEVGGEWYVAHGEHGESSTIDELVPNERLATSHEDRGAVFQLEGRAGSTVLRIVQSGFGTDELDSLERGWGTYVQTLRHYLALHADEPAESTYSYAASPLTVEQARAALSRTLPSGAAIFDETPRSIGARVPDLGDGIYRASIEGRDGKLLIWVHLVAYGSGRDRLPDVTAEVKRALDDAAMPDAVAPEAVRQFVLTAHGGFDEIRAMLDREPALVNAAWDWGGGDWETGLGAAAHMGRRDIAELLVERGARLDLFAAAMLGHVEIVRAIVDAFPSMREAPGPHGIPLIEHARKERRRGGGSRRRASRARSGLVTHMTFGGLVSGAAAINVLSLGTDSTMTSDTEFPARTPSGSRETAIGPAGSGPP
jgi:uncharacterized protein YndB with AHSA1/START domain